MNGNNEKKEEYLTQCGKFFQIAREECLIPGKDMLTQNQSKPVEIYWAASGIIENTSKAYHVYKKKKVSKEEELDQQWRRVIEYLNNESLINSFNYVLNSENSAKNKTIKQDEIENCFRKAESFFNGILKSIPTSDRIKIGL
ncbi:MAG: hypothetical protein WBB67_06485 [bacterium]